MRQIPAAVLLIVLAGCAAPIVSPSERASASPAAHGHDPLTESVKADLADAFGMTFAPAGPHHEIGRAPDGVELDLVGVPVEEVVLSLPTEDRAAGLAAGRDYLPYLAGLLGGPESVWSWAEDGLRCREDVAAACEARLDRAHLSARFTDGGPGYVVLVVSVEP